MEKKTSKEFALYRLERAKEELEIANLLYTKNKLLAANNRAYYSIFYAIRAIFAMEKIDFKRHKDVLAYFNKNYVHSGVFPKEIGRSIAKAAKVRHASDYDEFYIAGKEEAARQIQTAKVCIDLVDKFIAGG